MSFSDLGIEVKLASQYAGKWHLLFRLRGRCVAWQVGQGGLLGLERSLWEAPDYRFHLFRGYSARSSVSRGGSSGSACLLRTLCFTHVVYLHKITFLLFL